MDRQTKSDPVMFPLVPFKERNPKNLRESPEGER